MPISIPVLAIELCVDETVPATERCVREIYKPPPPRSRAECERSIARRLPHVCLPLEDDPQAPLDGAYLACLLRQRPSIACDDRAAYDANLGDLWLHTCGDLRRVIVPLDIWRRDVSLLRRLATPLHVQCGYAKLESGTLILRNGRWVDVGD